MYDGYKMYDHVHESTKIQSWQDPNEAMQGSKDALCASVESTSKSLHLTWRWHNHRLKWEATLHNILNSAILLD
jgi:hypothetical protein